MTDYDVEEQRRTAINVLVNKQRNVYQQGLRECTDRLLPFENVCANINAIGIELVLNNCSSSSRKITLLAVEYLNLTKLIARLENGEDPRVILYDIVSDQRIK